jgi:hypothetical protein
MFNNNSAAIVPEKLIPMLQTVKVNRILDHAIIIGHLLMHIPENSVFLKTENPELNFCC